MRTLICILLLVLYGTEASYGQLTSKTDVRFELTSIVSRLAGAEEYSQCRVPSYAREIDSCFAPYVNHPLIGYFQQLRAKQEVAYNAISSMAAALELHNGKFRLHSSYELNKLADTAVVTQIDFRWTKASLVRYVDLLNDFYKKSRFQKFYDEHHALYRAATEQLDKRLAQVHTEWFVAFFGKEFPTPEIYTSLCNGPSNYALTDLPGSTFGILIGCNASEKGIPSYSPQIFSTIIHEFAHSFANPLAFAYQAQMEESVGLIAPRVAEALRTGAYDQGAVLPEWLTRLCVLMYLRDNDSKLVPFQITTDDNKGFIWMRRTVEFMENFYTNRNLYPHFCDFMPQLVGFFNFTAKEFDKVVSEYENRHPYVVNVYPAVGSELDMTRDTVEFRISFSEPMATHCSGQSLLGNKLDELKHIAAPAGWKTGFWENEYTYVIRLKSEWVKTGEIYGFSLNKNFNQNKKNYGLSEDFKATFNTGLK